VDTLAVAGRFDLTAGQWRIGSSSDHLPVPASANGRRRQVAVARLPLGHVSCPRRPEETDMTGQNEYRRALDNAERLLGQPLALPLTPGEPSVGEEFRRLATLHTFGDSWPRAGLDTRSRALISVAIAATLGTHEPLRGQLRIALNSGVTREEIVELFIHLEAYAGAARAFDSYQVALAVFGETAQP
jgi:4-carboxymuconolactone decarboxylase